MELAGQRQSLCAPHSHEYLESCVARKVAEHAGIVRVIFDNQQDRIVSDRAPAEDLPDEHACMSHLVIGPGEDPAPGPDHGRGGHDVCPVPPQARHSDRAR